MQKMLTFDSFTLIPSYSDISSRNEVDVSTEICGIKSDLPIINANMLSICTPEMIDVLSNKYNTFSSYHRFFDTIDTKKKTLSKIIENNPNSRKYFWMSVGVKPEEYEFIGWLNDVGIKNIIVDVNHGHHKMVGDVIKYIKDNYKDMNIMAGNVSSVSGIKFLRDNGANVVKCGNSFGASCTTIKQSGFGVHPMHVIKTYREETNDWDTNLCPDGGIRTAADIAKSLIYGNIVMIGSLLAGCDESFGTKISHNGFIYKEFFGNASIRTKQVASEENHVKFVEGTTRLIPCTGSIENTINDLKEGLQSSFSFVGAKNLKEYQQKAPNQILFI